MAMLENDARVLRKLGFGEMLFDIEVKNRGMILVCSVLFESDVDLFEHVSQLDTAIKTWINVHPLLRCLIRHAADENPNELYFALASDEQVNSLDNVSYVRLVESSQKKANKDYWQLLHNRELNLKPFDSRKELMWRLVLAKLDANQYCLVFTVHHGISDGLNNVTLVDNLLGIIDKTIDATLDPKDVTPFALSSCIENVTLGENFEAEIKAVKEESGHHVAECLFPSNLANRDPSARSSVDLSTNTDKFVFVNRNRSNECLLVRDLLAANESEYVSKLKVLKFDELTVSKLLAKCKEKDAKIAGCLNVLCAVAARDLYAHFDCVTYSDDIKITMLASMRTQKSIGNLNMGLFANFLDIEINLKDVDVSNEEFFKTKFWQMAKHESDSIHRRIKSNELNENVKFFSSMLKAMDDKMQYGQPWPSLGVHCSLSSKGVFKSSKFGHFKLNECYSNMSTPEDRFASPLFHGVYTINNQFNWTLSYNSRIFSPQAIEYLSDSIRRIIHILTNN
jgi:hypothetical protein